MKFNTPKNADVARCEKSHAGKSQVHVCGFLSQVVGIHVDIMMCGTWDMGLIREGLFLRNYGSSCIFLYL